MRLMAVLLVLVAACALPDGEADDVAAMVECPDAPAIVGTYAVENHPLPGEACTGTLPYLNVITLHDDGTATLEDQSGAVSLARWAVEGQGVTLSLVQVRGWTATIALAPSEHFSDQLEGLVEWWQPVTHGSCSEWWLELRRWTP